MRKRKAPIGAVFFLVLLLAIVAFFNMRGDTPGVYSPDEEQHHIDEEMSSQEQRPGPGPSRVGQPASPGPVAP